MLKRLLYAARTSHSHSVLFSSARSMSSFNCNFSVVSSMLVLVTSSAAFWDACLAVTYAASFQNRPHSDSSSVFRGYVPKLTPAFASLVASSVLVLSVVSHVLTSSVVFLTWICPLSLQWNRLKDFQSAHQTSLHVQRLLHRGRQPASRTHPVSFLVGAWWWLHGRLHPSRLPLCSLLLQLPS